LNILLTILHFWQSDHPSQGKVIFINLNLHT